MAHPKDLGATGNFPRGRLNAHDEGELVLAVAADREKGVVLIDFGTPVTWLALPKDQALAFAESIARKAKGLP